MNLLMLPAYRLAEMIRQHQLTSHEPVSYTHLTLPTKA